MQNTTEKTKRNLYRNFLELVAVGSVTGIFAGLVVTVFNVLVHEGEHIAHNVYAYVRENPAFIPLLLLALAVGGFLIGVIANLSSVIRGCGIPQVEGATHGVVRFKWWRDLTTMFASCLLSIFMGLSIGAEGPSVLIGATAGDGIASMMKRNEMVKRYQITGGACAGLAVASNAPLTGIAFAFEEAHKRFTPEVFICAFTSVIFGVLTRTAVYQILGREIESSFHSYLFHEIPVNYYGIVLIAGLLCGLLGILFYKTAFKMRAIFKKIACKDSRFTHIIRILVAVLLGGMLSLSIAGVMGGGHSLIESMGTLGGTIDPSTELAFGLPLVWTFLLILAFKFLITAVNIGAGIPCGIFIPVIAIGACIGGVLSGILVKINPAFAEYGDLIIMICMAAFFTTVVKAPITSIIMICEFTGSFAPLLPVILAVFVGYFIGEMGRTDGIYEELLEAYEEETGIHERAEKIAFTMTLQKGAIADGRPLRDILWPAHARVKEILRGEEHILPNGDTDLHSGDVLTIVCRTDSPKKVQDELEHILH